MRSTALAIGAATAAAAAVALYLRHRQKKGSIRLVIQLGLATDGTKEIVTRRPEFLEVTLPESAKKLAGCRGVPVSALIPADVLAESSAHAIFTAADLVTEPIPLAECAQGVIVHSEADGSPLGVSLGGPLRAWYPPGVAVQASGCGGQAPVNVKNVLSLTFASVVRAAVVIFDGDGRALMLQHAQQTAWQLPGGTIEPGEAPLAAAVRACHGQSGLTPLDAVFVGLYEHDTPTHRCAVFATRWRGGRLQVPREGGADASCWLGEDTYASKGLAPAELEALLKAFALRRDGKLA